MSRPKITTSDELLNMLSAIDLQSTVALYAQIENLVQFAIASGRLKAGDQLPTIRDLADSLKVNVNTISKSYHNLVVMGLVIAKRGMGVYVANNVSEKSKEDCRRRILMRINEVICEARATGFEDKEIVDIVGKCIKSKSNPFTGLPPSLQAFVRARRK